MPTGASEEQGASRRLPADGDGAAGAVDRLAGVLGRAVRGMGWRRMWRTAVASGRLAVLLSRRAGPVSA